MKLSHFIAAALLVGASSAQAVYTVNLTESGGNVTATGSGSINTTGMVPTVTGGFCVNGYVGANTLCLGTSPTGLMFTGQVSPALAALTTGANTSGNASSGQPVFMQNTTLYLPAGYVSASPLSSSATFNGRTFASMGLTPGTRTFTLTSGDTIVINIGPMAASAPIPTLSEYGAMALASLLAMAGMLAMRRRKE